MNFQLEKISFSVDSLKLVGFLSKSDTSKPFPGVLFIHGGGKYTANLYASWQQFLYDHDYASLAYYHRGVGESEGKFIDSTIVNRIKDALSAYNYFSNISGIDKENISIYGSSMGAHVAVRLIEIIPQTKKLILQSGAAYSLASEKLPLDNRFTQEIRRENSWADSPVFPILKKFTGSTLTVYGDHDEVIPDVVKSKYSDSINRGKYLVIPNCGHTILRPRNENEQIARNELYLKSVEFLNCA